MATYVPTGQYGNTQQQPRSPRPSYRQYPEQSTSGQVHEQSQLIDDDIRPASAQSRLAHGTPVYMSSSGSPYTSYNQIGQAYTTDYKDVDLNTYPVASSQDSEKQPIVFMPEEKEGLRQRYPAVFKAITSVALFLSVGIIIAIPIILFHNDRESHVDDSKPQQVRNLLYYVFIMLLTTWCMTAVFYVIVMVFPFVFRFVTHYVNPAYKRYWRVFVMMRTPIVLLFAVVAGYATVDIWIYGNVDISIYNNADGDTAEEYAAAQANIEYIIGAIYQTLEYLILWAGAFIIEKILITYLTIHYHYRAHHNGILYSKKVLDALVALYDYSYTVYPMGHSQFGDEDWVIHRGQDSMNGKRNIGRTTVGVTDMITGSFAQGFGVIFGSQESSHWFSPRSSYAIVGRALQHPASSAALAKRLWVSLVPQNGTTLTVNDIKDALGPRRAAEAKEYFETLDENENGDIRLSELVPCIVEAGKQRRNIYLGMADMTHVVNTWDWILVGMLAGIMLGLVLISQVAIFQQIKELIGLSVVGISFVTGRTLNEFVQGAIFTILDHPYDVGDVVEIHTLAESIKNLLVVKRISLLYTVFEEVGSGKIIQYANMPSKNKKIANLTRSGKNREAITLGVNFDTTFKDLELLKQELKDFITAPENSRDYYPDLVLRVVSLSDLGKLELRISFKHKSNWSNDGLRAARSSRFHCAIVAAVRRVPINSPSFSKTKLGDEGKPTYTVMITDTEAASKRAAEKEKHLKKRMDYTEPEETSTRGGNSSLAAEELRDAEEKAAAKKLKDEEEAAKEAQEKEEEAEATMKMMGTRPGADKRSVAASTGIDLEEYQGQFKFITGNETGMRVGRRIVGSMQV